MNDNKRGGIDVNFTKISSNYFVIVLLALVPTPGQLRTVVLEGTQTSYAQYRQWHGGGVNCTLELEFQTSQPNGLLLYTDNRGLGEYMQLKLVNGGVNLRFNWGDGAHVLSGINIRYTDIEDYVLVILTYNLSSTAIMSIHVYNF